MPKTSDGMEFVNDIRFTVMNALYKKNRDFVMAEKVAESVKEAIIAQFHGEHIYILNLRQSNSGAASKKQVLDLQREGVKPSKIARLTGLTEVWVRVIIKANKVDDGEKEEPAPSSASDLLQIKMYAAKALLQNGVTPAGCKEISVELCTFLQKNWSGIGIYIPWPWSLPGERKPSLLGERKSLFSDDLNRGMSLNELAVKYSLTMEQSKGLIKRMKKKLREAE